MENDVFKEYRNVFRLDAAGKSRIWSMAVGLQTMDGLRPSQLLMDTAVQHIEGRLTIREAQYRIDRYYQTCPAPSPEEGRTEEADRVAARTAGLLSDRAFSLSPDGYLALHRQLFAGIFPHAGTLRRQELVKKEAVLDGAAVEYPAPSGLRTALEAAFSQEEAFRYQGLSAEEKIRHLAAFLTELWQLHPFWQGNARTAAVFLLKYLRTLGLSADSDAFSRHAPYFRDALIRAGYSDPQKDIPTTTEYLEIFLRCLLLDEKKELRRQELRIGGPDRETESGSRRKAEGNGGKKTERAEENSNKKKGKIEAKAETERREAASEAGNGTAKAAASRDGANADTDKCTANAGADKDATGFSPKTLAHIRQLYDAFGADGIFGRTAVIGLLHLQNSSGSKFLSKLLQAGVIEPVSGHGKGKYRFKGDFLEKADSDI